MPRVTKDYLPLSTADKSDDEGGSDSENVIFDDSTSTSSSLSMSNRSSKKGSSNRVNKQNGSATHDQLELEEMGVPRMKKQLGSGASSSSSSSSSSRGSTAATNGATTIHIYTAASSSPAKSSVVASTHSASSSGDSMSNKKYSAGPKSRADSRSYVGEHDIDNGDENDSESGQFDEVMLHSKASLSKYGKPATKKGTHKRAPMHASGVSFTAKAVFVVWQIFLAAGLIGLAIELIQSRSANESLQLQVNALQQEFREQTSQENNLDIQTFNDLRNSFLKQVGQVIQIQSTLKAIDQQFEVVQGKFEKVNGTLADYRHRLLDDDSMLSTQLSDINAQLSSIKTSLSLVKASNDAVKLDNTQTKASLKHLEDSVGSINLKATNLQMDVLDLEKVFINDIKPAFEAVNSQLNITQVNLLTSNIDSLNSRFLLLDGKLEELMGDDGLDVVPALKLSVQEATNAVSNLKSDLHANIAITDQLEEKVRALGITSEATVGRVAALEDKVSGL